MAISEAMVKMVKYPPELLPDSWYGNVPLNAEVAPPVLDLKNFRSYLVGLTNIQVTGVAPGDYANVALRARYNATRVDENAGAMLAAQVGAWNLPAKDVLYFNFFGLAAVANFSTHYGLWVTIPTIAQKLAWGISLTPDESRLAASLGIADTVQKGLLPLPVSQQIEREYHITAEETHSRSINIAIANTVYEVEHIYPRPGEIVVLTRIAAAPGGAANVVRLIVDRDKDYEIADVRTFPLSLVLGGEVACFIPATLEIRLTAQAAVAPAWHLFRYTFQRVRLTNILRARFNLVSRDEIPGETWDKCVAGVL